MQKTIRIGDVGVTLSFHHCPWISLPKALDFFVAPGTAIDLEIEFLPLERTANANADRWLGSDEWRTRLVQYHASAFPRAAFSKFSTRAVSKLKCGWFAGHQIPATIPDELVSVLAKGELVAVPVVADDHSRLQGLIISSSYPCKYWVLLASPASQQNGESLILASIGAVLARELPSRDGLLLHAAGVEVCGQAIIFTGLSGAGKTTVARMAGDRTVLGDDAIVIRHWGGRFYVWSTPWNPQSAPWLDNCRAVRERIPLGAMLFLFQAPTTSFVPLARSDTAGLLARQLIPPPGLLGNKRREELLRSLGLCAAIASTAPAFRMCFDLDTDWWPMLEQLVAGHQDHSYIPLQTMHTVPSHLQAMQSFG